MLKKIHLLLSLFLVIGLAGCNSTQKEELAIIPTPLKSKLIANKEFKLKEGMVISVSEDALLQAGSYLQNLLDRLQTQLVVGDDDADIDLVLDPDMKLNDGGYNLTITSDKVDLRAKDYSGIVSGIATICQMLPSEFLSLEVAREFTIPAGEIEDAPRFQWRGLMLDSSRHFWSKEEVKHVLDLMAYYKLNKLHWHLTDDQGWRVEIKQYPLLTEKGAWRTFNKHDKGCLELAKKNDNVDYLIPEEKLRVVGNDTLYGGFYSQEDIKDIVSYASQRGIDVVPEIDMPGHFLAAINQYPFVACDNMKGWGNLFSSPICVGKDKALEFCENIYKEIFELFPYEYVHMGGDEVDKTNWKKCVDCQRRMRKERLKSEEELQAWFVRHMENFFKENGKKFIGWDEVVADNLSEDATIMWWRGWYPKAIPTATSEGKQAINTHNVYLYFDYQQDKNTLTKLLNYNPILPGLSAEQESLMLGVQANVWTEWIPSIERLEYMIMPRMLALSEIAWAGLDNKMGIDTFYKALEVHTKWMDIANINYRIPDLEGFYDVNVFVDEAVLDIVKPLSTTDIRYTTDGTMPTLASKLYTDPIKMTETTEFKLRTYRKNGTPSDVVTTRFVKSPLIEGVDVEEVSDGLSAKWYDYRGAKCSEIESASLNGTYTIDSVTIPSEAKDNIGLIITGYVNIPTDGIYTFALLSDDGSRLFVDGEIVADNDGAHSPREIVGQKALKAGLHPIRVEYFDHNGGILKLAIVAEDGERIIPSGTWFKH